MHNISILQEQRQNLKLNVSLQQSIQILQMSSTELAAYITEEEEKNPFLVVQKDILPANNYHQSSVETGYDKMRHYTGNQYNQYNHYIKTQHLKAFVSKQILFTFRLAQERSIAFYLCDLLDDNGYIEYNENEIIKILKVSKHQLRAILNKLQTLDPPGVFARNIQESMTIQLKELNLFDQTFSKILSNLDFMLSFSHHKVAKKLAINSNELTQRLEIIKSLEPKPGRIFTSDEPTVYKMHDVELEINNGSISLSTNNSSLPDISVDTQYYQSIKLQQNDFVRNAYINATSLVKNVKQRSKTLLQVSTAIAIQQKDFFLKGIMHFKPMILSEIAQILELNESTICRAIANKYLATPAGLYPIKFFFSSKLSAQETNTSISSVKVKEIIKTLIASEDSYNSVISDDKIAEELKKFNINIARRTVAKYREAHRIPSSHARRRKYLRLLHNI